MNKEPASIVDFLSEIEDPRKETINKRHEFIDVLVIALCGMLSSADDWVSIAQYGRSKEAWFSEILELPNGIPSHDTFNRIFSQIDPDQFMNCFSRWIKTIRNIFEREHISIDGKTLRRSFDGDKQTSIHMVSAWSNENNLVLAQIKTDEKSNEITAIPELIRSMFLDNCLISIDAMGCQKLIAESVINQKGHYLLAVKDNQPNLNKAIKSTLDEVMETNTSNFESDFFETSENNRDRNEIRKCWVTTDLRKLNMVDDWKNLKQIAVVESHRIIKEKTSIECRYYICSDKLSAEELLYSSRAHWGIENKLHWVLDMGFREDESRVRKENGAENLARLRHIALNLLKQDTTKKMGIKNKRLTAGWDMDYLQHLLNVDIVES